MEDKEHENTAIKEQQKFKESKLDKISKEYDILSTKFSDHIQDDTKQL